MKRIAALAAGAVLVLGLILGAGSSHASTRPGTAIGWADPWCTPRGCAWPGHHRHHRHGHGHPWAFACHHVKGLPPGWKECKTPPIGPPVTVTLGQVP